MAGFEDLLQKIQTGERRISLAGLTPSSWAYLVSRLILEGPRKTYVYVASHGKEMVSFQRDLSFFLSSYGEREVEIFPASDVLPYSGLTPHHEITGRQIRTLSRLADRSPPSFIGTTVAAVQPRLPPHEIFSQSLVVRTGSAMDRNDLLRVLSRLGYQNVPLVIDRGHFAVRGGLVDVFGPDQACPLRMEWVGDNVESLREFDPQTQRSLRTVSEIRLLPVRKVLLDEDSVDRFAQKARALAEAKDLPRSAWSSLVDPLRDGITFSGLEDYLPLFYDNTTSFWDWLPAGTVLLVGNPEDMVPSARDHFDEVRTLAQGKSSLLDPSEILQEPAQTLEAMEKFPRISLTLLQREESLFYDVATHGDIRREIDLAKKSAEPLAPLGKHLKEWLETSRVFLTASSRHQAERVADLLHHYFPNPLPILESWEPGSEGAAGHKPVPRLVVGELTQGFQLPSERLIFLTETEIFGPKVRRSESGRISGKQLSSFAEIKVGDPIVHKEHGIGIYQGLVHMVIDGTGNDFLLIEYRGGDKLYLPAYRMNLVHRYTGSEGGAPRIDKLGGNTWAKVKTKAQKIIHELAGDLLNLYAARSAGKGFRFSPPNELFEAFEAGFPYDETPDQERAISEVLSDMQKDTPMDRLVLGDVGYGKTEVALRAAFKAVLDGKQVAFLVPTTLLAYQHHERFVERFKDYPVKVETLSRFRSAAEQKNVVRETAEGKVDILIGTHRLLQPDISFKDLGLLIMDEEHRFGVEHKEKLKKLRKDVAVLALTATPIPRTLYMSLVGLRPISVIETPPTDRLAIRTFVVPFGEEVIREALTREIRRGGQVFFLHNEVATIGKMKAFLQSLVPEAKIEIGHGQMEERALEDVMLRFYHQEFNVLLCTTIIESGIDIPTANTILVNEADHFGLAQIYQLRGRVGRGNVRAYAYLLVTPEKALTKEARQRLDVLQRFSDLGSGYQLASYDLEIRGAGNLLGREQSGNMTAIGYELYTELLETAIHEMKGEKLLEDIDPELHFKIPSFLPEEYVPDPPVRLELYRRLASLGHEEDADEVVDEMKDRFGPIPFEVENLLELSVIKCLAKALRIKQVRYDGKRFLYAFDPSSPLSPDLLVQRIKKDPKKFKLTPDLRFTIEKSGLKDEEALMGAKTFLRELSLHITREPLPAQ